MFPALGLGIGEVVQCKFGKHGGIETDKEYITIEDADSEMFVPCAGNAMRTMMRAYTEIPNKEY